MNKKLSDTVLLEVKKGETFNLALSKLVAKSDFKKVFGKVFLKINQLETALKPGQYEFQKNSNYRSVLISLSEGQIVEYRVTVPEGYNIFEIGDLLEAKKIIKDKGEFINLALNHCLRFLEKSLCPHSSLEGYLFPETYQFSENTKASFVIQKMVDLHLRHKAKILSKLTLPKNLKNWPQVVTMASVIEKETGAPWERPLISSVFHNRLRKRMRIQSDPTIIYGRWIQDGKRLMNIKRSHLQEKNNYNTYTISALPIGPISNPGRKALIATLKPETSEYLYFVSQNDGTHKFSKTYLEHQNAVRKFQMNERARKNKSWRDLKKKELAK